MFNEYFNLANCGFKDTCENINTYGCNNCTRNSRYLVDNYKSKSYNNTIIKNNNPCDNCSSNPKNGGSGICNCTLNLPEIR
jgi:hypothetical protein